MSKVHYIAWRRWQRDNTESSWTMFHRAETNAPRTLCGLVIPSPAERSSTDKQGVLAGEEVPGQCPCCKARSQN